MSLRARLLAGLLAITAAGLFVLAAVTYAEQRDFLEDRVDEQARAAVPAVGRELSERGIGGPRASGGPPGAPPGYGPPPGAPGGPPPVPGDTGGPPAYGQPDDRGGPGGRPAPVSLPPGTYGQRRSETGRVLGDVVLGFGSETPPKPELPRPMPVDELITVDARGDSDLSYRAVAAPTPGGGITIAAVPLSETEDTLNRLLLVEGLVIAGVLVALGLLAWWLVRLGLRPLDRIGETAGAIAAGELSHRVEPATPRTEVGRLGLALNRMLERLEDAFARREASEERLRRFVADASHELRTPLTAIRGYAEVLRTGAAASHDDRERAVRRIEEEAARMGVLVEDLLTLARLDEAPASRRERVDVASLARDAVDDARATAPDRRIELHGPDGAAVVDGDPDQLRQVLGNLLRNALVHTPGGTPIDVEVAREDGEVALAVRDHGPGLPVEDPAALFDRFWRAERGRERGKAGAGLGLAIVRTIVEAHGGRVSAADAPGGGARFELRLPAGTG